MASPDHPVRREIIGCVCYVTHEFPKAGCVLGVHNHTDKPAQIHTTVITRGRFAILGEREGQEAKAGDLLTWRVDENHGLRALEDASRAVNIRPAFDAETNGNWPTPNGPASPNEGAR